MASLPGPILYFYHSDVQGGVLELLHTHLGFVVHFLLVIISHYIVSYIIGENIPPKEYSLQLTLQFD
jgi:hypothetical protein